MDCWVGHLSISPWEILNWQPTLSQCDVANRVMLDGGVHGRKGISSHLSHLFQEGLDLQALLGQTVPYCSKVILEFSLFHKVMH